MKRLFSVDRVWGRNFSKIKQIIYQLIKKIRHTRQTVEDLQSEATTLFYRNFYERFEDDEQFMAFMYVSLKNRMLDIQAKEMKYLVNHKVFGADTDGADQFDILEQIAVDKQNTVNNVVYNEYKQKVLDEFEGDNDDDRFCRAVFKLCLEGNSLIEIGDDLGEKPAKIGNIRKKYLMPALKNVLNIPEEKYKVLAASGRLFSSKS